MKVSYSELFPSGNFRGRKFFVGGGESCNSPIFVIFILIVFMCVYICPYVINCLWVHFDGFSC